MPNLLQPGDPAPFGIENAEAASPIVFASDHAGRAIPARLGDLGLEEAELARHIGWDIGIHGVTHALARALDAVYVFQPYSRLVIDCNRRPGNGQSIVLSSDGTVVPANQNLSEDEKRAREDGILRPYHRELGRVLEERKAAKRATVMFLMHSCTPRLRVDPKPRPWEIGILANRDWRVGNAMIELLRAETDLCVGRNEPYVVSEEADYTLPLHAEEGGLPCVEIEIRQDLIAEPEGQAEWARLLADICPRAVELAGVLGPQNAPRIAARTAG